MKLVLRPSLNWALAFVPLTIALHYLAPDQGTLIFGSACAAVIPLAGILGEATEHLARRTSAAIGGLLNATFGNAAELIIGLMALRDGLAAIVKASLTGSIIGNVLLVLGASILAGGIRHKTQEFNPKGARMQSTMLTLAAVGFIAPAMYHRLSGTAGQLRVNDLSMEIGIVLLVTYALGLLFTLRTHKQFFVCPRTNVTSHDEEPGWTVRRSVITLAVSTAMVAWISEILVGSVEHAAKSFGMTDLFVGVVVVAIIGNAAEHSTAIKMAIDNRMDLALGIAVGSSIQVALFVAPVLLIASYFIGPVPMDLVFTPAEVMAVALAVVIIWQIGTDGESNWLEGVQLLAVYAILGILFYYLPDTQQPAPSSFMRN